MDREGLIVRVLLVQFGTRTEEKPVFPLGLSYLASVLDGHQVRIFDQNTAPDPSEDLRKEVLEYSPELIGISLRNVDIFPRIGTHTCFEDFRQTVESTRQTLPGAKIVVGGAGFSIFAREIMHRVPQIDFGVFLEGEESFPQLLENLHSPEKVKGIFFRQQGRAQFSGEREPPLPNSIPLPRRDLVDISKYKRREDGIGVLSKRGCSLRCAYCTYPFLNGSRIRLRSPKLVVDEIENLVSSYDVKNIQFADNVFNVPLKHAQEICQEILKRGIPIRWSAWFNERYMTEEFMFLAYESGCYLFEFSPGACANRTLGFLKRDITESDINKIYYLLKKLPVRAGFNLFVNSPGENLISFLKLIIFRLRLALLGEKFLSLRSFFNPIRIYPHTDIYRRSINEGLINESTDLLSEAVYYTPPFSFYISFPFKMLKALYKILKMSRLFFRRCQK